MNIGDFELEDFDTLETLVNKHGFAEIINQLSNVAHLRWIEVNDAGQDAGPFQRVEMRLDKLSELTTEEEI